MKKIDRLQRVKILYHFTDKSNIASIREHGGLWSTAKLKEKGIQFHPGGNQHSLDADEIFGLDQYVHLCFTNEHPMAYLARKDGRIEQLKWLYIDQPAAILELDGVRYSHEVSNKSGAELYTIEQAREMFDDEALINNRETFDWKVGDNYARRQAVEKCEILIPDHLPLKYFEKYLGNG
jgi:hypothetical protein